MGSLVSLVMTDIVGSTRRWNAAEGAMAADLELHDRLIRGVVEGAGGSVFKHTGDGMIAVFDDPVAAAMAAAGIQQEISSAQWQQVDGLPVRAAVHAGVVYPRDGDLFGTAVNRVARLLGICPPGAVLASNAVAGLLADRAPEGFSLRGVGVVTLAGFGTPEPVHAITGPGIEPIGALAVSTAVRAGGLLPRIDDEMIGRTHDIAAIWEALGQARLVTLVGVGGMGKTRLALEVAAGSVDTFPGGVWWVDLAAATTAEAVLPVAMAAVEAREAPGCSALQSLCDRFATTTALVVIDNCEHVLPSVFTMVDALRTTAPDLRIVATSREALGVRGELLVPVGSLPVGDAFTLFAERAVAARPGLDTTAERVVIERICTRLDGIPLAIELAAARCRSMTATEIDARLDDRFRLLRGGRQGAERHRTLQAAVAWSYEMLDDDERHVFHCLCVFAGGTLIDGLAAVSRLDEFDVLDIVDRLIGRSMVVASTTPLGTRYHQLETLRQYAEDRLVDAGEIESVRARHLGWAHQLATWISSCICTPRGGDALRRFAAEIDNLRVAVAHSRETGRHHMGHEIVAGLVTLARALPAWEVFDWVLPIELDGDWTPAAAVCAARAAIADLRRGVPVPDGVIAGLPEHVVAMHADVQITQAELWAMTARDWRGALDLLDRIESTDHKIRLAREHTRLLSYRIAQLVDDVSDDEFTACRTRGFEALEMARASGDDVRLCSIEAMLATALAIRCPDEARALALEGIEIASRVGAWNLRDVAIGAYFFAVGELAERADQVPLAEVMALRAAIARTLESGDERLGAVLSSSAFPLLNGADWDVLFLFRLVWRRASGIDLAKQIQRVGIPLPADWSVWEGRAERMSLNDAVRSILAALDRVIAEA